MKKLIVVLLVLTILISCKDDAPTTQQLLINSSVELGNINPNLWGTAGTGGVFNHEWSTNEAFSPTRSLKISQDVSDPGNFWYLVPVVQWGNAKRKRLGFES